MSRRFAGFAIAGVLIGAMVVGGPYVLADSIEAQFADRLASRGVDARWKAMSWRWPTTIEVDGLTFSAADGRIEGRAGTAEAVLPWDAAWTSHPHVEQVSIRSATVEIALKKDGLSDSAADDGSAPSRDSLLGRLARIDELSGHDIDVHWRRGDAVVADVTIDRVEMTETADQRRLLEAAGTVESPYARRAAVSLARTPVAWRASGGVDLAGREAHVTVSGPHKRAALIELTGPGEVYMSVQQVSLGIVETPTITVEMALQGVSGRVGPPTSPAVTAEAARVSALRRTGDPLHLAVDHPDLSVAGGQVGQAWRAIHTLFDPPDEALSARHSSRATPSGSAAPGGPGSLPGALATRLSWLAPSIEAVVRGGRFELRLLDRPGSADAAVKLVDELDASLSAGRLEAVGRSAGGQVGLEADFEVGSLLPRAWSVTARGVHVDDFSAMLHAPRGPTRGVNARIGGVVDADIVATTDGSALIDPDRHGTVHIGASVDWSEGRIDLPSLTETPLVGLEARLEVDALWTPAMARVAVDHGGLAYGPLSIDFEAEVSDVPYDPVVDAEFAVEDIACQRAVRALPEALLGAYADIEIDGRAAPVLGIHMPVNRPKRLRLDLQGFVDRCHVTGLGAARSAWPAVHFRGQPPSKAPPEGRSARSGASSTPTRTDDADARGGEVRRGLASLFNPSAAEPDWPTPDVLRGQTHQLPDPPAGRRSGRIDDVFWLNRPFVKPVIEGVTDDAEVTVGPGADTYVDLDDLPPFVAGAAYLSEEMPFYVDHGVDLGLIQKALRIDLAGGRFVYGGSTVTQQLVKNLFLSRRKTLSRKLREALIAWRIEDVVPKWRVLELYLNCIEYAQNVYGIGPAARHYFGKDADELSPKEAVFVAILKPAPWYGDRFRRRGHSPTDHWWFDRMVEIMGRLVDKGYLTARQADAQKPYVLYWDDDGHYMPDFHPPPTKSADSH